MKPLLRPRMQPWDPAAGLPLAPGQTPRPWQVDAYRAWMEGRERWRRCLVSAATGTGKGTWIAAVIVLAARQGKRVLFLVHRDELIDDVMGRALAIEPALPAGKVKGPANELDAQVVFASVQSLKGKRLKAMGPVDLVVIDEAHHATAPTYQRIWKRAQEANPEAELLGLTATPFRSAPGGETSGLGRAFDAVVFEYSLQDAVSDGALAPLECIRIALDVSIDKGGDGKAIKLTDESGLSRVLDSEAVNSLVVSKYLQHLPDKPVIAFCVSVAHAQHMAEAFRAAGVSAQPVWGDMPPRDREDALRLFRERPDLLPVLCNKDLLTEGFDAPRTEGVLLVRPTESRGLFAQMVGRATRLSPGKTVGLVLDFVANSETHSLASFRDLNDEGDPSPTTAIRVGHRVRHRFDKKLTEGAVTMVEGEEIFVAHVEWGPGDVRQHPTRELARIIVASEDEEVFQIVPRVEGVKEFRVMLFGQSGAGERPADPVGWYRYDRGTGFPFYTAAGAVDDRSLRVQISSADDGQTWEAWKVLERKVHGKRQQQVGHIVRGVSFDDAVAAGELAFKVERLRPRDIHDPRQADKATDRQVIALGKWGLSKDLGEISRGEASWLLESLICRAVVDPARRESRDVPLRGL